MEYGEMDAKILIVALCNLVKSCFEEQVEMIQRKGPPPEWKSVKGECNKKLIYPLMYTTPTMGAVNFRIFKQYVVPRQTLFVVQDPYGAHAAFSSYAEREYFYCMARMRGKMKQGLGRFGTPLRHVRFGSQIVDGYCKETQVVFQFDGCVFHFHLGCTLCPSGK